MERVSRNMQNDDDGHTSLVTSSASLSMRKNWAIFSEGPCKSLSISGVSVFLSLFFSVNENR